MSYRPCPRYAIDFNGKRVFCEVGPMHHEGTHAGSRSEDEYHTLRKAYLAEVEGKKR